MITVYLKPTNYCNIGCDHCYLPLLVRQNKLKITFDDLEKSLSFLYDMALRENHDLIHILWHGGEPLIINSDWYNKAGAFIDKFFLKKHQENGPKINFIESMQSSLIPYNSSFKDLALNRWGGEIGSSLDFFYRSLNNSVEDYRALWMKKVENARKDGILIIPGLTPSRKDMEAYQYIYKWFFENKFFVWNIERYSNVEGNLPEFPTNREHSLFLKNMFNLIIDGIQKNQFAPYIRAVVAGINGVLYDMPGDRWGGSCQSDFVVINPNGELNNCPDKDSFEASFGNVKNGFDEFKNNKGRKKWIRLQQIGHRIDECSVCENNVWCKSGCPITQNACNLNNGETDECSGYKEFINHIRNFIKDNEQNKQLLIDYTKYKFTPDLKNNANDRLKFYN